MIRKILLIAIAALLFSESAFSVTEGSEASFKQVEFDINGNKVGDKLTKEFFNQYCPSESKDKEYIECKETIELNGVKLSILYFFYDTKLLAISMSYPSSQYDLLINTYTKKFSTSAFSKDEPILVANSVEFTNKKSSWNTISGKFVIEKYGTGFTKGIAYLKSDGYEQYVVKKKEEIEPGIIEKIFGDIFDDI